MRVNTFSNTQQNFILDACNYFFKHTLKLYTRWVQTHF